MADQIIFTSAVRGIKPGASGYCTVLRSPGIRSALEHALEKISVFEHTKCNRGRVVYTYRQVEIRDKTYYALSRISDAGNDYTGRTNFLAHHLVFEKEELPERSPVDILLNWPGWCQHWEGEPRDEAVDLQSFQQISPIKPPAQLWKEQAIALDGALKLASDTRSALTLRSGSCSDEMLLQLIGEALAVRAKFNKSYRYAWITPFSVGLATVASAKSFKWLALRAADDYAIPNAGAVVDLDAPLSGGTTADEELTAIARDGSFRPAPKPIPLSSKQSTAGNSPPNQGARTSAGQPLKSSPEKIKLGSRGKGRAGARHVATKKTKKRKGLYALIVLMFLIASGGGYWLFQKWEESKAIESYEGILADLVKLHDRREAGEAIRPVEVEDVFEQMLKASGAEVDGRKVLPISVDSELTSKDYDAHLAQAALDELSGYITSRKKYQIYLKKLIELHDKRKKGSAVKPEEVAAIFEKIRNAGVKLEDYESMIIDWDQATFDQYEKNKAETAFKELLRFVQEDKRLTKVASKERKEFPGKIKVEAKEPEDLKPELRKEVQAIPLDLDRYGQVLLSKAGGRLEINKREHMSSTFEVATEIQHSGVIEDNLFSSKYSMANDGKALNPVSNGRVIIINDKIPNDAKSYAIRTNLPSGESILLINMDSTMNKIKLGQLKLEESPAEEAIEKLGSVFDYGGFKMFLVAEDGYSTEGLLAEIGNYRSSEFEKTTEDTLIEAIARDIGSNDSKGDLEDLMAELDRWVADEIAQQLKKKKEALVLESNIENDRKRIIEDSKAEALKKTYSSIMQGIREAKEGNGVESYFLAYAAELERLEDTSAVLKDLIKPAKELGLDGSVDSEQIERYIKKGIQGAYRELSVGTDRVKFSPTEETTYTLDWVTLPEGKEIWKLTYKYTGDPGFAPNRSFSENSLRKALEYYLAKKRKSSERAKAIAEAKKDKHDFKKIVRKWKKVEFKNPTNDQVLATVKVK